MYHLSKMAVPTVLFWGGKDILAGTKMIAPESNIQCLSCTGDGERKELLQKKVKSCSNRLNHSDPTDVRDMIPKIKNVRGNFFDATLDHLDYIWGMTAAEVVYHHIIKMIEKEQHA